MRKSSVWCRGWVFVSNNWEARFVWLKSQSHHVNSMNLHSERLVQSNRLQPENSEHTLKAMRAETTPACTAEHICTVETRSAEAVPLLRIKKESKQTIYRWVVSNIQKNTHLNYKKDGTESEQQPVKMQIGLVTGLNVTSAPVKLNWTQQLHLTITNRIQAGSRTAAGDTFLSTPNKNSFWFGCCISKQNDLKSTTSDLYKQEHNKQSLFKIILHLV